MLNYTDGIENVTNQPKIHLNGSNDASKELNGKLTRNIVSILMAHRLTGEIFCMVATMSNDKS